MKHEDVLVETDQLLTEINNPNIRIFDATILFYIGLSPEEAAKMPTAHEQYLAGHIPSSSCLPLTDLMIEWDAFLPNDQLALRLNSTGQHKRIITYCGGGIAATVNAMAYLMAGNQNVAMYDGSLFEWTGERLPVTSNE